MQLQKSKLNDFQTADLFEDVYCDRNCNINIISTLFK